MLRNSTRLSLTVGMPPAAKPITTYRPSGATWRSASSKTSPPTGSIMTSTPSGATSLSRSPQPSDSCTTWSAPRSRSICSAPVRCTIATTVAPIALATRIDATPTPPAEPRTPTISPGAVCARSFKANSAVWKLIPIAAPSSNESSSGSRSNCSGAAVTCSANPPTIDATSTRSPALNPESAGASRTTPATSVPGVYGTGVLN